MEPFNGFSQPYIIGGSITTTGLADVKPITPQTLASGSSRVRDLNQRLAQLSGVLDKISESLFGPSMIAGSFNAGAQTVTVAGPVGQLSELHEALAAAESYIAGIESRVSRLHNI